MNIELLTKTLEVSENPGLDTLDPRFNDITTLVQQADFLGAAAEAEKILEEEIYDIRLIGYFLYGVFVEQGVGMIAPIFQCLVTLLDENWEAVGPVKRREKQAQASLNWFMKQLFKKLDHEENSKGDVWDGWVEGISSDEAQQALDAVDELDRTLGTVLEEAAAPVLDGLSKIKTWLVSFQRVVYREPEPEPESEAEETESEERIKRPVPALSFAESGEAVSVDGSYHLQLLLNKISAFEQLIEQEKFAMAALVADDINDIMANFDPKVYFPNLFARFSLLVAVNIGKLISFEGNKGTPEWQSLQELYKVDLESFVGFGAEISFTADNMPAQPDYGQDEDDSEPQDEDYDEPDKTNESDDE